MKKNFVIPNHIGIILDGNGRWAKKRKRERLFGHKMGVVAVKKTIKRAVELKIKAISVYAFSTENWKRSSEEVDGIFKILENSLTEFLNDLKQNNIKFTTMGDISKLPKNLKKEIEKVKEETKNCTGLIFNVALNYGGQDEILMAVNNCIEKYDVKISKEQFEKELYTKNLPPLDLIIRTSGEQRLSNFMLYQSAYSELFFIKKLWPDFNGKSLDKIVKKFNKRERRFGNIK